MVDLISTESSVSLNNIQDFKMYAGGQVANLAMNLARLGFTAVLGACVGQDDAGDYLKESFSKAGVGMRGRTFWRRFL